MGAAPGGTGTATEPAGHPPAGVAGSRRMTCRMIGDPRWRGGGRMIGDATTACVCDRVAAGSGPSGVTWLQLAAVSMMPAAASTLARTDDGRGGWDDMSWVLLGKAIGFHTGRGYGRRCGRGGLGAGGVGRDQRGGGRQDEQFGQAHGDQVRVVPVVGD